MEEGENRGLLEEKGLVVVKRHRNEKVDDFFCRGWLDLCVRACVRCVRFRSQG